MRVVSNSGGDPYKIVVVNKACDDNKPDDGNKPGDDNKPDDGNKPGDENSSDDGDDSDDEDEAAGNQPEERTGTPAKTGDSMGRILWLSILLIFIATAGIAGTMFMKNQKKK